MIYVLYLCVYDTTHNTQDKMNSEDFVTDGFPTASISAGDSSFDNEHNAFSSETEDIIPGQYMPMYSGIISDSLLLTAKVGTLFFDGFNRIYATMDSMMIGLSFGLNKSARFISSFIARGFFKLFRLPSLYEKIASYVQSQFLNARPIHLFSSLPNGMYYVYDITSGDSVKTVYRKRCGHRSFVKSADDKKPVVLNDFHLDDPMQHSPRKEFHVNTLYTLVFTYFGARFISQPKRFVKFAFTNILRLLART